MRFSLVLLLGKVFSTEKFALAWWDNTKGASLWRAVFVGGGSSGQDGKVWQLKQSFIAQPRQSFWRYLLLLSSYFCRDVHFPEKI
jgi:hypothetical protein